jgi:hypothetical protein
MTIDLLPPVLVRDLVMVKDGLFVDRSTVFSVSQSTFCVHSVHLRFKQKNYRKIPAIVKRNKRGGEPLVIKLTAKLKYITLDLLSFCSPLVRDLVRVKDSQFLWIDTRFFCVNLSTFFAHCPPKI